jgi:FixJ family two-component response regulator
MRGVRSVLDRLRIDTSCAGAVLTGCGKTRPQPERGEPAGRRARRALKSVRRTANRGMTMTEADALVFVVDDDESVREAISSLLRSAGLTVLTFESAQEFLRRERAEVPGCLVLDVRMPGLSGLDLQAELSRAGIRIPVIFLTGHGDIPMSVRAMKAGAVEFFTKPFHDQGLLDAVREAIGRDRAARREQAELDALRSRFDSLTPREREVMALVVRGLLNKQIAFELEISEITVKVHRHQVVKKMRAESVADLVRMAERLGISSDRGTYT